MKAFTEQEAVFIRKLPVEKRRVLLGTLMLYLFQGCQQDGIRKTLAENDIQFDLLSWRRNLHRNGALLRDGKILAYGSYLQVSDPSRDLELDRGDRVFVDYALEHKPLQSKLKRLSKNPTAPYRSVQEMSSLTQEVLTSQDLLVYCKKYVRRQMSFLLKSYNTTMDSICGDLLTWSLFALMKAYPRIEDPGHGIAIAKTTAKHRGVNLIKSATAQRNNALIQHENGAYERTTVSMSSITDGSGQFLTADGTFIHRSLLVVGINGASDFSSNLPWEWSHSLKQLLSSPNLNDLHKKFLSLLIGSHDEMFSEWLGQPNEVAIERSDYAVYMNNVCKFMGVPHNLASQFLSSLRKHL